MRHASLALVVIVYALAWGQNWTTYAGALMLAAILKDWRAHEAPHPR